ncbi:hypothetical protein [Pseudomonas amygdali]|uniref:Uncharacterized protein n=2 Tax=Pseudomonas amygdali pv. lachrymans TaxID=53707 RepID=A0ABR5KRK1_PSEAV|nr:hypothetical protein [Pseudomonas amygdali]AXH59841.1 hypothetical protein PLA107_031960 [Pseudomonas amygdali pv. lachrymans str. M301315]KPC17258.1 Uncharacterized protein AC499_0460 [Pseudomonas amygdali pv. lachrymans]KPC18217.1 Uncharacterized protein AC499_1419 [Pseudomonas amygdali pv. lachrymans]
MNAAQTVRLMEKLKAVGALGMDHPGRGLASVEAMDIVHSSKVSAEQLATLFELQPKDSGLSTAQDFGIMMLWSLSMNSDNFGATLALGHADLQREAPYFLSGPLSAISGYFCNNMAKEVCKDNPQNLPPSLIDETGKISFDEKAYMQFHAHTLRSEITEAMEDDPERFSVMVRAIKASPHGECFEETLRTISQHPSMKVLPIGSPVKRALMGEVISPEEIFGYIDHLASSITLGDIPLDQKKAILNAAHEGIHRFRALDEEAIAQYLDRKLDFSSNEDMKWELHDPHKSTAMLLKELDPTGILVARSYATYKGKEFSSIERVLESMVDEISDKLPGQYLGNRDVWLSGAIMMQPPELLMSLKLKNEGWYKLYQLTESPAFKEKVRGRHLDRVMGQDLGL